MDPEQERRLRLKIKIRQKMAEKAVRQTPPELSRAIDDAFEGGPVDFKSIGPVKQQLREDGMKDRLKNFKPMRADMKGARKAQALAKRAAERSGDPDLIDKVKKYAGMALSAGADEVKGVFDAVDMGARFVRNVTSPTEKFDPVGVLKQTAGDSEKWEQDVRASKGPIAKAYTGMMSVPGVVTAPVGTAIGLAHAGVKGVLGQDGKVDTIKDWTKKGFEFGRSVGMQAGVDPLSYATFGLKGAIPELGKQGYRMGMRSGLGRDAAKAVGKAFADEAPKVLGGVNQAEKIAALAAKHGLSEQAVAKVLGKQTEHAGKAGMNIGLGMISDKLAFDPVHAASKLGVNLPEQSIRKGLNKVKQGALNVAGKYSDTAKDLAARNALPEFERDALKMATANLRRKATARSVDDVKKAMTGPAMSVDAAAKMLKDTGSKYRGMAKSEFDDWVAANYGKLNEVLPPSVAAKADQLPLNLASPVRQKPTPMAGEQFNLFAKEKPLKAMDGEQGVLGGVQKQMFSRSVPADKAAIAEGYFNRAMTPLQTGDSWYAKAWAPVLKNWKTLRLTGRPGYLPKQVQQDSALNFVQGANPLKMALNAAKKNKSAGAHTSEEVLQMAEKYGFKNAANKAANVGAIDMDIMPSAKEFVKGAEKLALQEKGGIKNQVKAAFKGASPADIGTLGYSKVGAKGAKAWDEGNKLAFFQDRLKRGDTPDIAAKRTYDSMFDYADPGEFPKLLNAVRQISPMAGWSYRAATRVPQAIARNPGAAMLPARMSQAAMADPDDKRHTPPEYIQDSENFAIGGKGREFIGDAQEMITGSRPRPGLGFNYRSPVNPASDVKQTLKGGTDNFGPALTVPGNFIYEKNLLTGRDQKAPDSTALFPAGSTGIGGIEAGPDQQSWLQLAAPFLVGDHVQWGVDEYNRRQGRNPLMGTNYDNSKPDAATRSTTRALSTFLGQQVTPTSPEQPLLNEWETRRKQKAAGPTIKKAMGKMRDK